MINYNIRKRGLTLIEALIIMLILAVIAAVLFPLYPHYYHGSRQITCASNMKQLGLGLIQYAEDYDSKLPDGLQTPQIGSSTPTIGAGWGEQIYTYVKSTGVYKCPDDKCSDSPAPMMIVSYAYNRNALRDTRLTDWTSPSATIALFEVTGSHFIVWPTSSKIASGPLSPVGDGTGLTIDDGLPSSGTVLATGKIGNRPIDVAPGRHTNEANYLFADGHVKYLKPAEVSSGSNASSPKGAQTGGIAGQAAGTENSAFAATFSTK